MNRIIFLIEPVEGHFNPFIPIIKEFTKLGYQVVCITGSKFRLRVEQAGARFKNLPEQWDPGENAIYDFFPELKKQSGLSQVKYYLKHILFDQVPDTLNALKELLDSFPADVTISDTFMVATGWMTELGGPPNVRLSVLPLSLPGKNIPPYGLGLMPGKSLFSKLKISILNILFLKILFNDVQKYANKIRAQLNFTPFKDSFFKIGFKKPDLVLHTSIQAFEYPRKEYPPNFQFIGPIIIPPRNDYSMPEWWQELDNEFPVVLINQGTIAVDPDYLIIPAIEGLKDENLNVIAVPVNTGEIPDLPKNTHTEPYIPFGNLLPHVDVMITNGGFGGTQNALAYGIPVIVAGATEDKMEVAARVEYSGAGINLGKKQTRPEDITKAVRKILKDPSYRNTAQKLKSIYAQYDAPSHAVRYIKNLIEHKNK
jgi:UDP:flavonoid glycosyltransferase YjiC (YdhE family)